LQTGQARSPAVACGMLASVTGFAGAAASFANGVSRSFACLFVSHLAALQRGEGGRTQHTHWLGPALMFCLPIMPCAVQWYLTHNENGTKRTKPRDNFLLGMHGCDVAANFLRWLEKGAPGYIVGTGRPRRQDLVSGSTVWMLCTAEVHGSVSWYCRCP
jgi:hypothetical protein